MSKKEFLQNKAIIIHMIRPRRTTERLSWFARHGTTVWNKEVTVGLWKAFCSRCFVNEWIRIQGKRKEQRIWTTTFFSSEQDVLALNVVETFDEDNEDIHFPRLTMSVHELRYCCCGLRAFMSTGWQKTVWFIRFSPACVTLFLHCLLSSRERREREPGVKKRSFCKEYNIQWKQHLTSSRTETNREGKGTRDRKRQREEQRQRPKWHWSWRKERSKKPGIKLSIALSECSLFSHSSCVSRILFFQGKGDRTRETVSNACCTPCSFSLLLLSDDDLHVHVVVGEGRTSIPGERNTKISPEV